MITLNGRFLAQPLSGVQRYAREITGALDALVARGEAGPVRLVAPPDAEGFEAWPHLASGRVGARGGQAWEQFTLPRAATGMLLNLGNTAPLLAGARQAVVIHDAGVFDTPESYSWRFRLWYRLLQRGLVARGARILSVSDFSAGRIAQHLGIERGAIGVTLEGGEHILRAAADASVLARHRLAPGGYALAVGTGAAHKNLAALAAAGAALGAAGLTLAVAGARDRAVFQEGGAALADARALGRVTDAELRALYENAFALVFPSRYEGFGLPPLEAMWCGCPVIAARAGAVPEVCGEAALWFDADDPATLAAAITALAADPARRATLAAAGHARAPHFSWEAAARRLLGFVTP
jgi:glycosyltransferase involved in cell wall biosynthesis